MIYKVEFEIDNDCRLDKHTAIVTAENMGEAIFKFNQYIDSKLKYDEVVTTSVFTKIEDDESIIYCDF
jgi:hypothetical protein